MAESDEKNVHIRPLGPGDFDVFWPVRLLALRESPEAFGASYEHDKDLPVEQAITRLSAKDGGFVLGGFRARAGGHCWFCPQQRSESETQRQRPTVDKWPPARVSLGVLKPKSSSAKNSYVLLASTAKQLGLSLVSRPELASRHDF